MLNQNIRRFPSASASRSGDVRSTVTLRPALNDSKEVPQSAGVPPIGYRLVDDDSYEISRRDMVYVGGDHPYWMPARRAGEVGSMCRFSVAMGVARYAA